MEDRNGQTMTECESLLVLNDDCLMQVLQRLPLVDFPNLAHTCHRLQNIARDFSSRKHKKIKIQAFCMLSWQEFSKVLSVIGDNVVEVELSNGDAYFLKFIKRKCKNLKQLKLSSNATISINEWRNFFASSPELEVLDFDYGDGHASDVMDFLTLLPQLRSLRLPYFRDFQPPEDFQNLLLLTGLKKLSLRSTCHMNSILIDLANHMNLVELDILMKFNVHSLGIIKSFRNLEVLTIGCFNWNPDLLSNASVLPPRLQRLKICGFSISCSKFLEILHHLTFLKEFDLGGKEAIFWDDSSINIKDSQALVIKAIENALIRNRRNLNILRWDNQENSLYVHRSANLQIINCYLLRNKDIVRV